MAGRTPGVFAVIFAPRGTSAHSQKIAPMQRRTAPSRGTIFGQISPAWMSSGLPLNPGARVTVVFGGLRLGGGATPPDGGCGGLGSRGTIGMIDGCADGSLTEKLLAASSSCARASSALTLPQVTPHF